MMRPAGQGGGSRTRAHGAGGEAQESRQAHLAPGPAGAKFPRGHATLLMQCASGQQVGPNPLSAPLPAAPGSSSRLHTSPEAALARPARWARSVVKASSGRSSLLMLGAGRGTGRRGAWGPRRTQMSNRKAHPAWQVNRQRHVIGAANRWHAGRRATGELVGCVVLPPARCGRAAPAAKPAWQRSPHKGLVGRARVAGLEGADGHRQCGVDARVLRKLGAELMAARGAGLLLGLVHQVLQRGGAGWGGLCCDTGRKVRHWWLPQRWVWHMHLPAQHSVLGRHSLLPPLPAPGSTSGRSCAGRGPARHERGRADTMGKRQAVGWHRCREQWTILQM